MCEFDLVIKHAKIIDGSGNPWYEADIGLKDGRIARIGQIESAGETEVIDATG